MGDVDAGLSRFAFAVLMLLRTMGQNLFGTL